MIKNKNIKGKGSFLIGEIPNEVINKLNNRSINDNIIMLNKSLWLNTATENLPIISRIKPKMTK